ncbi:MAG: hypothetical protein Q9163_001705 [Psora crenata]
MGLGHRPVLYATTAFVAGVLVCLGFTDLYPDIIGRRYRRRYGLDKSTVATHSGHHLENDHIGLEDHDGNRNGQDQTIKVDAIPEGIEACIGGTPLFRIRSLSEATGCDILAKAEGSRIFSTHVGIQLDRPSMTSLSISPMSRCMPSDQSTEKSDLLLKLGATVERVPPAPIVDPMHFVNRARSLAAEHTADPNRPGRGYFADQFENKANWQAHFESTGPELFRQCDGRINAFVAGAGTGGTIAGVARFLKQKLPYVDIVLADPQGSGLYNRIKYGVLFDTNEKEGTRRRQQVDTIVEGIGINRVTANFEVGRELIDDAIKVDDDQALAMARWLVEKDGIFVGSSSAVNCVAALKTAKRLGPGKRVVTVLCDSGSRHLSRFWYKAGNIGGKTDSTLEDLMNGET